MSELLFRRPPIDPKMDEDLGRVLDIVLDMYTRRFNEEAVPKMRLVLDIPAEWAILYAWMGEREMWRSVYKSEGPHDFNVDIPPVGNERNLAKWMFMVDLRSDFCGHLHNLSSRLHPCLWSIEIERSINEAKTADHDRKTGQITEEEFARLMKNLFDLHGIETKY